MFTEKKILLGVTGSIAAYKAPMIAREFIKRGADVRVCMTRAGEQFITPTTFRSLTGNPVITDMFEPPQSHEIAHISWARWADLYLVAPATANIVGKAANGIADDYVSTTLMSAKCPILIAPAMNTAMYDNPVFQKNMGTLAELGMNFVDPSAGELACGDIGRGRLAEIPDIVDASLYAITDKPLAGKRAIVTSGATREYIDPVRFLSNPSTGKMGNELARFLRAKGAEVILITGNITADIPYDVTQIKVKSANDMKNAVLSEIQKSDILVMTAAVSDWTPEEFNDTKLKKAQFDGKIVLKATDDILLKVREIKDKQFVCGFALETHNLIENAQIKLKKKKLDMIIANLESSESGFGTDTNSGEIITNHKVTDMKPMPKWEMARKIVDEIIINIQIKEKQ